MISDITKLKSKDAFISDMNKKINDPEYQCSLQQCEKQKYETTKQHINKMILGYFNSPDVVLNISSPFRVYVDVLTESDINDLKSIITSKGYTVNIENKFMTISHT